MTYASVIGREETVRIALTVTALNDLGVKTADVQNAYLTAPCAEKIWTTLGPEFGPDEGKKAIIVRALYGLKSAGASFSNHLAECMRTIGYLPCKADGDLWYKPMVRPEDGFKYYAYMLLYVDDVLHINHDAQKVLFELDHYFMMKKGSVADPDIYLGG
jgi:Reverse transcriptase (RNA-dependent DNA polymerase)